MQYFYLPFKKTVKITNDLFSPSLNLSYKNLLIEYVNICLTKTPVLSAQPNILQTIRQFVTGAQNIIIVCNSLYNKEMSGLNVFGTRVVNYLGNQKIEKEL